MDNFKLYKTMTHEGFCLNDGTPYQTLYIYINESYVCLVDEMENLQGIIRGEFTMPRKAAKWIAASIRHKFWESPENGGLPANQHHLQEEVDSEILKINRVMTMGRPGQKGFMITNLSRKIPDLHDSYEEFGTPDIMLLEGGLLDVLAEL